MYRLSTVCTIPLLSTMPKNLRNKVKVSRSRSLVNSVPVTSRLHRSIDRYATCTAHSLLPFGSHDPNLREDVDRWCTNSVASVPNTYGLTVACKIMSVSCIVYRVLCIVPAETERNRGNNRTRDIRGALRATMRKHTPAQKDRDFLFHLFVDTCVLYNPQKNKIQTEEQEETKSEANRKRRRTVSTVWLRQLGIHIRTPAPKDTIDACVRRRSLSAIFVSWIRAPPLYC